MKTTTTLIATLAFAFAGTAFAQEATYELPLPATSNKARADVIAEVRQARADGTLGATELQMQQHAPIAATLSRADVHAQTLAAASRGELLSMSRESSGFEGPVRSQPLTLAMVTASK